MSFVRHSNGVPGGRREVESRRENSTWSLRLLPISSVLPSPFAFFLRRGPIPFVIGPINGGLPWPTGFRQANRQKEWISDLRSFYRFLPFARSTYRNAAAIIAGSSHTYAEFAAHREKLFFVPGRTGSILRFIHLPHVAPPAQRQARINLRRRPSPLQGVRPRFASGCLLLQTNQARFTVVGDGSEQAEPRATRQIAEDREGCHILWAPTPW